MPEWIQIESPVLMAFLATCFTWFVTALGAATVLIGKEFSRRAFDAMLGFAGGVMIAASFFSLLAPAIEMSEGGSLPSWFPAVAGFLAGIAFLRIADYLVPHIHIDLPKAEIEGVKTSLHRTTLLVFAITLHNFPEGLAIGVAFGAAAAGVPSATLAGAIALAIGIAIQDFPEGMAVSMPVRRLGVSKLKSFWYGQLSGIVEIAGGVIGAAAVTLIQPMLPYALAFAAGAMIYVVIEEVVPESQRWGHTDIATIGAAIGFAVMMALDVGFS